MRYKKVFIILLLFFSSIAISFLLAEYFTRRFKPQERYNFIKQRAIGIYQKGDKIPSTLQKNVKNYRFTAKTVEFSNLISTNSYGFRSGEITQEKPKDVFRILMLSDSMTFGWGVEDNQTFSAITQERLNSWAKQAGLTTKFEVINAGFTAGKSLDTYYVYLKEEGLKFNPDLIVINHFVYNDYAPDISSMNWEEIDAKGLPNKISSKTEAIENGYLVGIYDKKWKYEVPFLRNSHFGLLLMSFFEDSRFIKRYIFHYPENPPKVLSSGEFAYCLSILIDKYCTPEMFALFQKGQLLFMGTRDLAVENKSQILVTILTSTSQIEDLMRHNDVEAAIRDANPQKTLDNFFDKNNITYLDFLPYYAVPNYKDYFYSQDKHLNKSGHELAAKQLSALIAKKYFPGLSVYMGN